MLLHAQEDVTTANRRAALARTKGCIIQQVTWNEADTINAQAIWAEYLKQHDLSERIGQAAGIDPQSGRIWFGESMRDIVLQRKAEGLLNPLFFERVGALTYYRKGSHR